MLCPSIMTTEDFKRARGRPIPIRFLLVASYSMEKEASVIADPDAPEKSNASQLRPVPADQLRHDPVRCSLESRSSETISATLGAIRLPPLRDNLSWADLFSPRQVTLLGHSAAPTAIAADALHPG